MPKIGLYLMGAKGYYVLRTLVNHPTYLSAISFVVASGDEAIIEDYLDKIKSLAETHHLNFYNKKEVTDILYADYYFAISWRWMLKSDTEKLIVFHDSLLPKYRGFAPLVAALTEGDSTIGVTAIKANSEFDRGDIIAQKSMPVAYPIIIKEAIERISILYGELAISVLDAIFHKTLIATPQDETLATYSLWRDEEDYCIDWETDSSKIKRFIDATGFPYKGAKTTCEDTTLRIIEAEEFPDIQIVNRAPGKIIFLTENGPVIVCGKGLLLIKEAVIDHSNEKYIFKKLRIRLK